MVGGHQRYLWRPGPHPWGKDTHCKPEGRRPAWLQSPLTALCLGLPALSVPQFPHLEDGKPKMQAWGGLLCWAGLLPLGLWNGLWLFCLDNRSLAGAGFSFGF